MPQVLRALIVEDSEDDALLLRHQLTQAGYQLHWRRVETRTGLIEALAAEPWDIVFADYSMPQFSGSEALAIVRERGIDLPFMFVSGAIGEDTAVEAMKAGAQDYIMKGNRRRLLPAVARELREAEARRTRAAMEQELRQRQEQAIELERARQQAERESEFKSRFLANMSHELRTPLNAIIGFSELLQQEISDPLTPTQHEYVQDILDSGLHLLSLVNDILDLSKIDAGKLELQRERLALATTVDAARATAQTLADKRGVRLEFDVPGDLPELEADPLRLRQILFNLLSNAIKFTPSGGKVRLSAHAEAAALRIGVADTGIGIAAQDIPRLFSEFERVVSAGEYHQGAGLGLALTRRLVQAHGGAIAVESTPGAGSVFTVTLPLPQAAAPVAEAPLDRS
jgi:signal transduction histidine kinase